MADLWHPRAIRNPAASNLWGTYTGGPYKGVLHTTETDWYHPTGSSPSGTYDGYGHNYFPHATIVLENGVGRIYQHIPVNRAARALVNAAGGVQTNNDSAVQCEIVWRASRAPQMPKPLLDAVADWMRWVEAAVGVKRKAAKFAPPNVNVRMTQAVWDSFDGWCGHQHVPENTHTDPGAIDTVYLLGAVPQEDDDLTDADRKLLFDTLGEIRQMVANIQGAVGRAEDPAPNTVIEQKLDAILKKLG